MLFQFSAEAILINIVITYTFCIQIGMLAKSWHSFISITLEELESLSSVKTKWDDKNDLISKMSLNIRNS